MELQQIVAKRPKEQATSADPDKDKDKTSTDKEYSISPVDFSQQENMAVEVVVTKQPSRKSRGLDNPNDKQEEEKSIKETCSAFCQCLCSLGLCVLFPCTSECCKCVQEPVDGDRSKISYYLATGPGFLAEEIWRRFSTSFSTYSTNMTTLLKEPIQDEDNRFFRIKASLTSIFVQEVYISTCLICTDKNNKLLKHTTETNF